MLAGNLLMLFCFAVLEVKQQADSQLAGTRTFGSQQRKKPWSKQNQTKEAKGRSLEYFAMPHTQQKPAKLPGKETNKIHPKILLQRTREASINIKRRIKSAQDGA